MDIIAKLGEVFTSPYPQTLALSSFLTTPVSKLQAHVVSRQMGTTTTIAFSAAIDAITNNQKSIVIMSRSYSHSDFVNIIREYFSDYIAHSNKQEIVFHSGSKVLIRTLALNSLRGMAIYKIYVDAEITNSATLIDIVKHVYPMCVGNNSKGINICCNSFDTTDDFVNRMASAHHLVISYPNYSRPQMLHQLGPTMYSREYLCKKP